MKKGSIFQILGIGLILCSFMLLIGSGIYGKRAASKAIEIVEKIEVLLPSRVEGSEEDYINIQMPVLQIDGHNFSGLLEVPSFGVTLPVYDAWEDSMIRKFPCRFSGSVYDGSMVVGGADQTGQFDFCSKLDLGAYIQMTDMTGARFDYMVTKIERSKKADAESLIMDKVDLTLFVRDRYSLDYIVVRCCAEGMK